jgi:hypothetical protein
MKNREKKWEKTIGEIQLAEISGTEELNNWCTRVSERIKNKKKREIRFKGIMRFCREYGCCRTHAWKVLAGRRESLVLKRAFAAWKAKPANPSTGSRPSNSDLGTKWNQINADCGKGGGSMKKCRRQNEEGKSAGNV